MIVPEKCDDCLTVRYVECEAIIWQKDENGDELTLPGPKCPYCHIKRLVEFLGRLNYIVKEFTCFTKTPGYISQAIEDNEVELKKWRTDND